MANLSIRKLMKGNFKIKLPAHFCLHCSFYRSVIGHSIVHRVLLEYLTCADEKSRLVCCGFCIPVDH